MIADPLKQPLVEQQSYLVKAVSTASDMLKATLEEGSRLHLPDKKDVQESIAKSKKSIALVTGMLAAIAKNGGN